MVKKAILNNDLSWIILEELRKSGVSPVGLAIVPDRNNGDWRVVIEARSRAYLSPDDVRRLAAMEKRLRRVYVLQD
ncbi:hypothetical protein [Bradyrhizobium sp. 62]|uniref:hypothetical protein n=1 Tax=Bradyrhizobium sp. 62 TaxID=1043588 RepID=UPI001FF9602E|nr:hypothetical protein [Bradyrhizobium sp. 62]MCK1364170.1 hypothetical protein [Bradyrhizobium sp. 62]